MTIRKLVEKKGLSDICGLLISINNPQNKQFIILRFNELPDKLLDIKIDYPT